MDPEPTRNRGRGRIAAWALFVLLLALTIHFDMLNYSEEEMKPGLGLCLPQSSQEGLYLALHALVTGLLVVLLQCGLRPTQGTGPLMAVLVIVAFQTLSEVWQSWWLPDHEPIPDYLAKLAGAGAAYLLLRRQGAPYSPSSSPSASKGRTKAA